MRRMIEAQKIREKRNIRKKSRLKEINFKFLIITALFSLGVIFYFVIWMSGLWDLGIKTLGVSYEKLTLNMGFTVDDILLEGRQRVQKKEISKALNIKLGESILKFDPWVAKAELEKLPWIRSSLVERRLPNLIYVRLSERHPIARWRHGSHIDLIDDQGAIINLSQKMPSNQGVPLVPQEFKSLPLFIGENAQEKASDFLKVLSSFPLVLNRVTASSLVGGRRWNIYIDKTIEVRLPELKIKEALDVLTQFEKQDLLFARDIKMIDLRFLPKIIIRPQKEILPQKQRETNEASSIKSSNMPGKMRDA
ncbi:MAG: cell division protein FtsQ/DivIB [Proteobacteria bacterium]|nr:cell division protein FtsQ/DivIB [Pseudomonadota bacterium]